VRGARGRARARRGRYAAARGAGALAHAPFRVGRLFAPRATSAPSRAQHPHVARNDRVGGRGEPAGEVEGVPGDSEIVFMRRITSSGASVYSVDGADMSADDYRKSLERINVFTEVGIAVLLNESVAACDADYERLHEICARDDFLVVDTDDATVAVDQKQHASACAKVESHVAR
jgi:hypothetical protein